MSFSRVLVAPGYALSGIAVTLLAIILAVSRLRLLAVRTVFRHNQCYLRMFTTAKPVT